MFLVLYSLFFLKKKVEEEEEEQGSLSIIYTYEGQSESSRNGGIAL
jgi:hypothetical protein